MNVSELSRKLRTSSKELLEILPLGGFDIGKKAIKIDNRQAQRIVEQWPRLLAMYRAQKQKEEEKPIAAALEAAPKQVTIPSYIRVKDFAEKLHLPLSKVMSEMMKNGVLSSMNEEIDYDTAAIIGTELGYEISLDETAGSEKEKTTVEKLEGLLNEDDKSLLKNRPPVVVVMGHVDHGKTKLLDYIRQTNIIDTESGGITQHIGAYQVEKKGQLITFIDTPGHEAFTTMRSRGARVADIAILVIAADDSIQPQTEESIKIIKSANLPMIVAINKIDKPDANIEKVKQDLAQRNLLPEDWGGKTICVPISAKQGTGIDDLLEMIVLITDTERENIKANPDKTAVGTIIESHIDRAEGPVATMLVQSGTLHLGDLVEVSDTYYGKIRVMKDFKGQSVNVAAPSMPVKILGLKAAASVGDILQVVDETNRKRKISKYDLRAQATDYNRPRESVKEGSKQGATLNLIIRADVLGSLEAIIASIMQLEHPEVSINIIIKGLGNITDADIIRAENSNAVIFGFHVKLTPAAENLAKEKKVELKLYQVIYHMLEDIKARVEKLLTPDVIRTDLGRLKVLAIFRKEKDYHILGGTVTKGVILPNAKIDVMHEGVRVGGGRLTQLQVNKVDVNEIPQGRECGVKFEGKAMIEEGDNLEAYQEEVKIKKL